MLMTDKLCIPLKMVTPRGSEVSEGSTVMPFGDPLNQVSATLLSSKNMLLHSVKLPYPGV